MSTISDWSTGNIRGLQLPKMPTPEKDVNTDTGGPPWQNSDLIYAFCVGYMHF